VDLAALSEMDSVSPHGFEVGFLGVDGREVRQRLDLVRRHGFEDVAAVRSFPSFRGPRNNSDWWWLATTGRHVGFESWLERDHLIALDFDPVVVGVSSQPFWLFWHDGHRERAHAPDYFARLADGTGAVIDCRPAERVRPRDAAAFAATEQACAPVGWRYVLVAEPEPVRMAICGGWPATAIPAAVAPTSHRRRWSWPSSRTA
jgi:hypothetical protein